jgi:hypothetical protein
MGLFEIVNIRLLCSRKEPTNVRTERELLEEAVSLSRLTAEHQSLTLERLVKLLEASVENHAMVNALLKPAFPLGLGGLAGLGGSTPGATKLNA